VGSILIEAGIYISLGCQFILALYLNEAVAFAGLYVLIVSI